MSQIVLRPTDLRVLSQTFTGVATDSRGAGDRLVNELVSVRLNDADPNMSSVSVLFGTSTVRTNVITFQDATIEDAALIDRSADEAEAADDERLRVDIEWLVARYFDYRSLTCSAAEIHENAAKAGYLDDAARTAAKNDDLARYSGRATTTIPTWIRTSKVSRPAEEVIEKVSAVKATARYAGFARAGTFGLNVVGVGFDGYTAIGAYRDGDTEKAATYGVRAVGGAMLMTPVPGVMLAGGLIVAGSYVYEYREEIGDAARWTGNKLVEGATATGQMLPDAIDDIEAGMSAVADGAGAMLGRLW